MPPTFLIFLGLIIYIGITILTLLIFVPLLFIDSKKLFAKKVITTILISLPSLIVTSFVLSMIFILPGLLLFWIINQNYFPQKVSVILIVAAIIIFAFIVATCSLYVWYFLSKIFFQRIEKKSISDVLNHDKIFNFLKPYLRRTKLFRNKNFLLDK